MGTGLVDRKYLKAENFTRKQVLINQHVCGVSRIACNYDFREGIEARSDERARGIEIGVDGLYL